MNTIALLIMSVGSGAHTVVIFRLLARVRLVEKVLADTIVEQVRQAGPAHTLDPRAN